MGKVYALGYLCAMLVELVLNVLKGERKCETSSTYW